MRKLLILVLAIFLGGCGFEQVDNGYRGVQFRWGKVDESRGSMPPDLYFYNPFSEKIQEVDIRTQVYEETLHTYTKDVQQATIIVKVNYRLNPAAVHTLVQHIKPSDVRNTLILPAMQGDLKKIIGRYEAVELVEKRGKATDEIETALRDSLAKNQVVVERIELVNIDYTKEFEKAVEDKVVAVQQAVQAVNNTKRIQEEAKQQVISAQAQAESMRIRANALANNPKLVEYEAVQRWDGKMPQYMLGNSVPFIGLK